MAEEFKNNNNINFFLETSAKTGFNAKEIFVKCAITLYKDFIKLEDEFGIQKHYSLSSKSTYIDSKNKSKNENSKLKKQSKQKKKNDKEGCC